jgi:hypothetical protein
MTRQLISTDMRISRSAARPAGCSRSSIRRALGFLGPHFGCMLYVPLIGITLGYRNLALGCELDSGVELLRGPAWETAQTSSLVSQKASRRS